jgi:DNA processing protein
MTPYDRWSIALGSPDYPKGLSEAPDPPTVLYGLGDPALLGTGLAIVGSRRATPYGLACARRFATWSARTGVLVVSGGATGCDSEAHRAVLASGGSTVAVLGCGADVDYPARERATLDQIRHVGCVVSEMRFGSPPVRWAFPRRNRIIAALSAVVLVVEASLPSGTFSTADHALDAGREVAAVPGSIFAAGSMGTNRLIRQGAHAVTCEDDLADALLQSGVTLRSHSIAPEGGVMHVRDAVHRAVLAGPVTADEVVAELGLGLRDVLTRLGALEADGSISRYPDGRYGPG